MAGRNAVCPSLRPPGDDPKILVVVEHDEHLISLLWHVCCARATRHPATRPPSQARIEVVKDDVRHVLLVVDVFSKDSDPSPKVLDLRGQSGKHLAAAHLDLSTNGHVI